jgi:cyclic pyranopterin phosphate synthase
MLEILQAKSSPQSFSLRVSVLENCQYRCSYCLPGTVKPFAHKPSWLKPDEYRVLAGALAQLPITKIRFTGGEPLLRRDLAEIVAAFKEAHPKALLSVTTNAERLMQQADGLLKAGISAVNIHIDSLNPVTYKKTMGDGDVKAILAYLPEAKRHFDEVKINVVIQKGVNDQELCDFLDFSVQSGIEVRFIELMNTGSARNYVKDHFLSGAEAIKIIEARFAVRKLPRRHASDPAALFELEHEKRSFGLIASDTQPFCDDCNRLRINALGELRGCLYQPSGVNLASLIRNKVTSEELNHAIDTAVKGKRSFHPLVSGPKYSFSMAEIGG